MRCDEITATPAEFDEIMSGANYFTAGPHACVPFTKGCTVVIADKTRLKHFFKTCGFRGGSENALVVSISGYVQRELRGHFLGKGLLDTKTAEIFILMICCM